MALFYGGYDTEDKRGNPLPPGMYSGLEDVERKIFTIVKEWDDINRRGIARKEVNFAPYLKRIMAVIKESTHAK